MKYILIMLVISISVFIIKSNNLSDPILIVESIIAEKGSIESHLKLNGRVNSDSTATVSSSIEGQLTKIHVQVGSKVEKDELIVSLDAHTLRINTKKAQSLLQISRDRLIQAKQKYEDTKYLFEIDAEPKRAVENAFSNYMIAIGEVDEKTEELKLLKIQLTKANIRSPISGIIMFLFSNVGERVSPASPIFKVTNIDSLVVNANIDASNLGEIFLGQTVKIIGNQNLNSNSNGVIKPIYWNGKIISIFPAMEKNQRTNSVKFKVSMDLSNVSLKPKLDERVHLNIITAQKKDIIKLPFRAIIQKNSENFVALEEKGLVVFSPVKIGIQDLSHIEIVKGLTENSIVILPSGPINENMKVQIVQN